MSAYSLLVLTTNNMCLQWIQKHKKSDIVPILVSSRIHQTKRKQQYLKTLSDFQFATFSRYRIEFSISNRMFIRLCVIPNEHPEAVGFKRFYQLGVHIQNKRRGSLSKKLPRSIHKMLKKIIEYYKKQN